MLSYHETMVFPFRTFEDTCILHNYIYMYALLTIVCGIPKYKKNRFWFHHSDLSQCRVFKVDKMVAINHDRIRVIISYNNYRYNINWRDFQRKNVVYNVDMSSLRAPSQKYLVQTPTHRTTQKHVEHRYATDV